MANDPNDKKKDFTSILDLQKLQAENPAPVDETPVDPFAVNELQPIEQVNEFQSIDQIGMMDHPEQPAEDPFNITPLEEPAPMEAAPEQSSDFPVTETPVSEDPFAAASEPVPEAPADFAPAEDPFAAASEPTPVADFNNAFVTPDAPAMVPSPTLSASSAPLQNIKNYSEKTQAKTSIPVKVHYPFHLKINGNFGPYERDKLLLFITDNPIGLSSSELDLQITSGKVFLPRISEYAAIKLVQELRDSGLNFQLTPSDREGNETTTASPAQSFHYEAQGSKPASSLAEIPVFNANATFQKPFEQLDEVSIVQYVRTEVLEVENSPMIQEVIERMTEALKQKARLKGGNALFSLQKEITPLRLPSQYQISLKANVIKL